MGDKLRFVPLVVVGVERGRTQHRVVSPIGRPESGILDGGARRPGRAIRLCPGKLTKAPMPNGAIACDVE